MLMFLVLFQISGFTVGFSAEYQAQPTLCFSFVASLHKIFDRERIFWVKKREDRKIAMNSI